jgi:hypothetical protein
MCVDARLTAILQPCASKLANSRPTLQRRMPCCRPRCASPLPCGLGWLRAHSKCEALPPFTSKRSGSRCCSLKQSRSRSLKPSPRRGRGRQQRGQRQSWPSRRGRRRAWHSRRACRCRRRLSRSPSSIQQRNRVMMWRRQQCSSCRWPAQAQRPAPAQGSCFSRKRGAPGGLTRCGLQGGPAASGAGAAPPLLTRAPPPPPVPLQPWQLTMLVGRRRVQLGRPC